MKKYLVIVALIAVMLFVHAEDLSNVTNTTPTPTLYDSPNYSIENNSVQNISVAQMIAPPVQEISPITLLSITPNKIKEGDTQFILQIQNNLNSTRGALFAIVTGQGFSTYDITPSSDLSAGEKGFIIVSGNFKEAGTIQLKIIISDQTFYQNVTISSNAIANLEAISFTQELSNITKELNLLKQNYSDLEKQFNSKKDKFDLSGASLTQLKTDIRNTESNILSEDYKQAKITLNLAKEDYLDQKAKIDSATKIPLMQRLKDNAVLFSAIAGSIITFFALYELLRKKSEHVVAKVSKIKK